MIVADESARTFQTLFAVKLTITFPPVGTASPSADVLVASYGSDTQGLP